MTDLKTTAALAVLLMMSASLMVSCSSNATGDPAHEALKNRSTGFKMNGVLTEEVQKRRAALIDGAIGLAAVVDSDNKHGELINTLRAGKYADVIQQLSAVGSPDKTELVALAAAQYATGDYRACSKSCTSAKETGLTAGTLDELANAASNMLAINLPVNEQPKVNDTTEPNPQPPGTQTVEQVIDSDPFLKNIQRAKEAMKNGDWSRARQYIDEAGGAANDPKRKAMMRVFYLQLAAQQGKFDEAIATADGAINSSEVPADMIDMFKGMRESLIRCRDQGDKWPSIE